MKISNWDEQLEKLLPRVSKPGRYLGTEVGSVHKDPDAVRIRFALAFPDAYEIGMSHLGFRIVYHLLNRREDTAAERFFSPWTDMEDLMREEGVPALSLESRRPLTDFDVIGFSLPYEMGYTNVLNLLDLGGVPLKSENRPEAFPLVIAGGPCTVNPEPIAPFFDAFVVGDSEQLVDELMDALIAAKEENRDKRGTLESLAKIQGVYVPAFFEPVYDENLKLSSVESRLPGYDHVRRRISPQLHSGDYPESDIVPFTSIVHDRVSIEVARGCTRGCRFCQAGYIYRPVRERSPETVIDMAENALSSTGYEDLSLLSLSTGDYSAVEDLVRDLMVRCKPKRVALSLPSMRVGGLSEDLMRMIKEVRKTGITIAPEAGTERLRKVVNKDIEEDEIVETAKLVFEQGWLSLKLYFMIGLPTETEEDIDGIVGLCDRIRRELGFSGKSRKKFTVSVSTFVPKPHTPFQWASQLSPDKTRERLDRLRNELKRRKIQMKWQDPRLSLLEGAFPEGIEGSQTCC